MKKNGITLIALVVTIIVMLILVAVTVFFVLGPDGIIAKSVEAKVDSRYGTVMDRISTRNANLKLARKTGGTVERKEDFINSLITEGLITSDDKYSEDFRTIYIGKQSDDTYKYIIDVLDNGNELADSDDPGNEYLKNLTLIVEGYEKSNVTLPISNTTGLTINWDATNPNSTFDPPNGQSDPLHVYPQDGIYEVQIKGFAAKNTVFGDRYNYHSGLPNILELKYWGENGFIEFSTISNDFQGEIPMPSKHSFKNATRFYKTFENSTNLTRIPAGLFSNCQNASYFQETFAGCTSLESIPVGLFNDCEKVKYFDSIFAGCTNLKSIPNDLFDNCSNLTNIRGAFAGCTSLTSIPEDLFNNLPYLANISGTFAGCTSLTSIPTGLLYNSSELEDVSYTFSECSSLTSFPIGLFNNCPNITNFQATFYNCQNLTGNAPNLWGRTSEPEGYGCFYKCTNLDNYDLIPPYWKSEVVLIIQ